MDIYSRQPLFFPVRVVAESVNSYVAEAGLSWKPFPRPEGGGIRVETPGTRAAAAQSVDEDVLGQRVRRGEEGRQTGRSVVIERRKAR